VLLWEKDPNRKGRILVKVRVTDLLDIPRSIRMTESSRPEAQSWTFLVEILLDNLLGGGPADEDPLPDDGVDPHPLPGHALPVPQNPAPVIPAVQNDPDNLDGWGHWAMGAEQEQPQPMEVEEQQVWRTSTLDLLYLMQAAWLMSHPLVLKVLLHLILSLLLVPHVVLLIKHNLHWLNSR
jgi:hypothetical protein